MRHSKNSFKGSSRSPQKVLTQLITKFLGRRFGPAAALVSALIIAVFFAIPKSANRDAVLNPAIVNQHITAQPKRLSATTKTPRAQFSGKVVKVSDGDTITLLLPENRQLKVRLLGIDAPEKSQPFGEACRQNLANKIAGKEVAVEVVQNDRYGRSLGKIQSEGQDMNLGQIKDGCAWHYKQYASNQAPKDRDLYAQHENDARTQKKGLWKDPSPQQPWQYRIEGRQGKHRSDTSQKRGQFSEQ